MWPRALLLLGIAWGLVGQAAAAESYPKGGLLIEPETLAKHHKSPDGLVVLDARDAAQYEAGHVPGALRVDHPEWAKGFGDGDDAAAWTKRLGALGLDASSRVVIYDDNSAKDAARIWWILRYWGLDGVRLLNGGWKGWQSAGLPIETERHAAARPTQPQLKPMAERLATKDKLLESLTGGKLQIVDARSEDEFCGIDALSNERAGSIVGARHLEWSDLVDPDTDRFKPADELAKLFSSAGIDLDRPTATHCQSGGRASVMAFGLELMGATDVSNYYRGWSEWGNADDTPIAPGKKR